MEQVNKNPSYRERNNKIWEEYSNGENTYNLSLKYHLSIEYLNVIIAHYRRKLGLDKR